MSARRVVLLFLAALALAGPRWALAQQPQSKVVRSVGFKGNKALETRILKMSIATTGASRPFPLSLFGKGKGIPFNEREFRRDVLRVQALYGVRGFPDAKVDTSVTRTGNDIRITFLVSEGEPIVIDSLEVTGLPETVTMDRVEKELPLQRGEPFDRLLFQTSVHTVEAILHNEGYAFAKVTGGFRAAPDARSVTVQLAAVPGPRATIARVDVTGNERIDKRVILKALSIWPGQVYSDKALHQSQIELYRSEMFRQVRISIEDSLESARARDSLIDVSASVELAEYPLQRARLSAGYGTMDCFRTLNSLDLFNFTGGGRKLEIRAGASKIGVASPVDANFQNGVCPVLASEDTSRLKLNYNLSMTLHEPLLFSRKAMGTATVFTERHTEYKAFLREAVGTELAVTRQLGEDVPARISYGLSYGRTVASAVTFCALLNVCGAEDTRLFSARRGRSVLTFEISRDRTNSVLDATEGTATALQVKWSPAFLGSDSLMQFAKVSFKFEAHRGLGDKNVLSTRFEIGSVIARTVNFGNGAVRYAPPEERFYLGGANSVRGYAANQLGPLVRVQRVSAGDTTTSTSALGGNFMTMGSIEARFAIPMKFPGVYGAIFVDGGQVNNRSVLSLSGFRVTPGVGLRIASLLGPIRLDLGFNPYPITASALYAEQGENLVLDNPDFRPRKNWYDYVRFNFSIGQAF